MNEKYFQLLYAKRQINYQEDKHFLNRIFIRQYRVAHKIATFLIPFILIAISLLVQSSQSLPYTYNTPSTDQFIIMKISSSQTLYFNQNYTLNLTYPTPMKSVPKALITYRTISLKHFTNTSPQVAAWFNIRAIDIQKTYTIVYSESANQIINPGVNMYTFDILLSCVDERYFQIVNWEYNGARIPDTQTQLVLEFTSNPISFNYCFSDSALTVRQKMNYVLSFNGFKGANWVYLLSDINYYPIRSNMHIISSSVLFQLRFTTSQKYWVDKYYLSFLFFCPNSYLLKQKYIATMRTVILGTQMSCVQPSDLTGKFFSLSQAHNYSYIITTRFIQPYFAVSSLPNYNMNFELINTNKTVSTDYFYQSSSLCGAIDFNAFFIVQKYCITGRNFDETTGNCLCNETAGFYDIGVDQCQLRCALGQLNVNNQTCKLCKDIFGVGCLTCDINTCFSCDTLFQMSSDNTSCLCTNDRVYVNNSCKLCSSVYDPNCYTCDSNQCLVCQPSYVIVLQNSTNICKSCQSLFGTQCSVCFNSIKCFSCDHNFLVNSTTGVCQCPSSYVVLSNGNCQKCSNLWGSKCLTCISTKCLTCSSNYIVNSSTGICECTIPQYFLVNNTCFSCQSLWNTQCISCTNLTCLSCSSNYSISSSNYSCYCPPENTINSTTQQCISCQSLFGNECLSCNQSSCKSCSKNYILTLGICICPASTYYINTSTGYCTDCKTKYGNYCVNCDENMCMSCLNGYVLNNNSDGCVSNIVVVSSNCSIFGAECLTCTQTKCLNCIGNYQVSLLNGTCSCSNVDRILFISQCYLCSSIFGDGCQQCTNLICTKCKPNWVQYSMGSCICQKPNQLRRINGNNVCYPCSDVYGTQNCTLKISIRHIQVGDTVFVQMSFNHPFEQLTQIVDIAHNLQISYDNHTVSQIKFSKTHLILQIPLDSNIHITNTTHLNISFLNLNYLKWYTIPLSNQPELIRIYPFNDDYVGFSFIQTVGTIIQWAYPAVILSSFGTLNHGFQMWFIIGYYMYVKSDLLDNGYTQNLLLRINKVNLGQIIPTSIIPHFDIDHKNVDFKQKVFQKNKGILQSCQQILVVYLLSVAIAVSLGNYIKKKKNWHSYGVYINYLTHYEQYIITNFLSLYPFLVFYIAVELQNLFYTSWSLQQQSLFINLIITITLIIVIIFLPFLGFGIYPPLKRSSRYSYSVIYNKIHPCSNFMFIEHFFMVFKSAIFVCAIFLSRQYGDSLLGQLILIGFMLTCLFFTCINYRKYLSRMYWWINVVKIILLISFQVNFLFLPQGNAMNDANNSDRTYGTDKACFVIGITLIVIDFIEIIVKIIRVFISNKNNWEEVNINSNKIVPLVTNIDEGNQIIENNNGK